MVLEHRSPAQTEWVVQTALLSHSIVPDSWRAPGLQPSRPLCPWDPPGKNTGGGCHVLLQGIFPTQGPIKPASLVGSPKSAHLLFYSPVHTAVQGSKKQRRGRGNPLLRTGDRHANKTEHSWDLAGGPAVKTSPSNAGGAGSIPGWGAKTPPALRPKNQNIKHRSNIVTNSIRTLKMVYI